jgi:hypothetical protein
MQHYIKWIVGIVLGLLVAGLIEGYLLGLIKQRDLDVDRRTEQTAKEVAATVARYLKDGYAIDQQALQKIFQTQPQLGYIIIDDWMNGLRSGDVNQRAMRDAPAAIQEHAASGDFDEVAGYLIQEGKGGASIGFEVLQVELRDELEPGAEPKAVVKMGYVVPGYSEMYRAINIAQFALLVFVFGFLAVFSRAMRGKNRRLDKPAQVTEKEAGVDQREEVDLLESGLPSEPTEIVALSHTEDLEYEQWVDLLSEDANADWDKRGLWYAISDFVMANPWQASLVRKDIVFRDYVYRVKAKKLVGSDGWVVLFSADGRFYVWVLGGWHNTRCELAGHDETRTNYSIEANRWYDLTVEVLPDYVKGYVNGDKVWDVQRSKLKDIDYSKDFLGGIGVGCWNTVVKFKDMFVLDKNATADAGDDDKTEV